MAEAFERLLVGRTLAGRYEIREVIGRGGMSVVYRAVDGTLGRPVALKVISLPADTEEMRANLRERFRREAGSAASIPPHPNVVQVYDYGTDPELDLDFIVMELLVGRDLKEALAIAPPSREEAVRILRESARGLAAGHRVGIVHRDVKPANVFLAGRDRLESVRILDFGIAKPLAGAPGDDLTLAGQLPHSPAYAAPEQVDPERQVTAASDVYQLGLIGYELLAGERAYGDAERERIRAGEDIAPKGGPRWETVPPALRETVLRALRPRPEDRYADAAEFAEALSSAAADDRTLADPAVAAPPLPPPDATLAAPPERPAQRVAAPPPPAPARKTGGRGRRVAALVGLLAVAAVVWALIGSGGDAPASAEEPVAVEAPDAPARAEAAPGEAATEPADTEALAREFEELEAEAAQEQMERAAAAPTPPTAPAEEAGAPGRDADAEARAAAEVQEAIVALNDTWVNGDLDTHLAHYADRVDFYSAENAPRSRVREERARDLSTFNRDRQIRIVRQAVTFPEPDRALALVDKEWEFEGDRLRRTGAGRQEMILERRDGRWLVVSEKMAEVYRSRQERA